MGATTSKRIESGRCSKLYASIATDTDLLTEHPVYGATDTSKAWLPRQFVVFGAGSLAYAEQHDTTTTISVPITAPYTLNLGGVRTLKAATTATNILVIW